MKTYVALFRGINVGGRNQLPMKELTAILESLGFTSVRTYIQSGNAVFQSRGAAVVGPIAATILKKRGFAPAVMLLTADDLAKAIAECPFDGSKGTALHLFFLDRPPEKPDLDSLERLKAKNEEFELRGKVFYLFAPDGIGRSKLAPAVERKLGVPATARNWNTVMKLGEMAKARRNEE